MQLKVKDLNRKQQLDKIKWIQDELLDKRTKADTGFKIFVQLLSEFGVRLSVEDGSEIPTRLKKLIAELVKSGLRIGGDKLFRNLLEQGADYQTYMINKMISESFEVGKTYTESQVKATLSDIYETYSLYDKNYDLKEANVEQLNEPDRFKAKECKIVQPDGGIENGVQIVERLFKLLE
jgi:hypothetical protein